MIKRLKLMFTIFMLSLPLKLPAQISTDAPILLEILLNTVKQVNELMVLVESTKGQLELAKEISRGLDGALDLYGIIAPPSFPGLHHEWVEIGDSLARLKELYGDIAESSNSKLLESVDRSVVEAITLNNKILDYAADLDIAASNIEAHTHQTSQKGATKLTAQAVGVLLKSNNQILRTNAAALKIDAQSLALKNRVEKERTKRTLYEAEALSTAMKDSKTSYDLPRL